MTIYLPDELAAEVGEHLGDSNISGICQAALRRELDRNRAQADLDKQGYRRVEVYDSKRDHDVAFRGNNVGETRSGVQVYITPKRAVAAYDLAREELHVFESFAELDNLEHQNVDGPDVDLLSIVAQALGEEYVEELDI